MKKLVLLAIFTAACGCGDLSVCGSGNTVFTSPSGTPTPTPVPGATPDPCRIEAVRVGLIGGAQVPFIALGAAEQLDATPVNSSGDVPKGCNVAREPVWVDLTPTVCVHVGGGYNPFLRALRVGTCSVTANVANVVSPPFSVEVR